MILSPQGVCLCVVCIVFAFFSLAYQSRFTVACLNFCIGGWGGEGYFDLYIPMSRVLTQCQIARFSAVFENPYYGSVVFDEIRKS